MSNALSHPLVGRNEEVAALRSLCARAREGRGGAALVRGVGGIGKSALIDSIAGEVMDFELVRGFAWEFAAAPGYFPLQPCFRWLSISLATAVESEFVFWEAVVTALTLRTNGRKLLLIVEDVHAADEKTLELLCFLAQSIRALPVALIVSLRPRDVRLSARSQRVLARLAQDAITLDLAPMDAENTLALASRCAKAPLSAALRARIVSLSGGNPLFVVECAKALPQRPDAVPVTLRDAIIEQLGTLSPATQGQLRTGAVLGRTFSSALAARMQGCLPALVNDDLLPALRRGLLDELGPGQFSFAHELTRAAIYGDIPPGVRATLHARAEGARRSPILRR